MKLNFFLPPNLALVHTSRRVYTLLTLPSPALSSFPLSLLFPSYLLLCDSTDRKTYLPEQRVKLYMYQLCKSIYHMHRNGIFHRDVKPENILVKVSMSQTVSLKQGFKFPHPPPVPPSSLLPLLFLPSFLLSFPSSLPFFSSP